MHPPPEYFDVAALFEGSLPEPPTPDLCLRNDGVGIVYRNQYNVFFGDPEGGKTLLADFATVEELAAGGRVLRVDLDHNGPNSTLGRLLDLGADKNVLRDPKRFLYIEPDDRIVLAAICLHMALWKPTLVVLDSIGELLPMFGSSSNSADEFTNCHRAVIKPLVRTGAAVVGIDHLSKGSDSRAFGPGGTIAKIRAIGGASIRVKVDSQFTPGKGGSAYLSINKDRGGGLRKHSPAGDKEPLAGKFVLWPSANGGLHGEIRAAQADDRNPAEAADAGDVTAVAAMDPPPNSYRDVKSQLHWGDIRARKAFNAWKETRA